jgi:two-component sensor histidine kinase
VKNNLEVVSSLLELQSAQIDDPDVQNAMQENQSRVQSMRIIHQKLYRSKNLASIEMRGYFVNLGEGILDSFAKDRQVTVDVDEDILFDVSEDEGNIEQLPRAQFREILNLGISHNL